MQKPKFATARKPPGLTAEQAAFIESGPGKDKLQRVAKPAKLEGATRRINVDVPLRTAVRFKAACSLADIEMADELRAFIERRTAELEQSNT